MKDVKIASESSLKNHTALKTAYSANNDVEELTYSAKNRLQLPRVPMKDQLFPRAQ